MPPPSAAGAPGSSPPSGWPRCFIALSFAEVSSRFEATGGPYLYTRAAFGRFAAFEVGWMLWFTRAASWAAVINVLATALGFYVPALGSGWPRSTLIAAIIIAITAINIRGIRQSSLVLNVLTVGKLIPLVTFVVIGIFFIDPALLVPQQSPSLAQLSSTGLLLIFAFGGYEIIPVPAGEARDPRRAVPFALIMTIVIVTIVMTLVQVVALGTFPGLAGSKTPLVDAAVLFMGGTGAALLTIGAVFSTTGNNMGQALSGSRNLFALAEQGDLPRFFGWVHPRYRTPVNAILVTVGRIPGARRIRQVRGPGAGQRDQPAAGLRRDVRVDAAVALAGILGTGHRAELCRSVRPGDSRRRDRDLARHDRRRAPGAAHRGCDLARGRRGVVLDRRSAGVADAT